MQNISKFFYLAQGQNTINLPVVILPLLFVDNHRHARVFLVRLV